MVRLVTIKERIHRPFYDSLVPEPWFWCLHPAHHGANTSWAASRAPKMRAAGWLEYDGHAVSVWCCATCAKKPDAAVQMNRVLAVAVLALEPL